MAYAIHGLQNHQERSTGEAMGTPQFYLIEKPYPDGMLLCTWSADTSLRILPGARRESSLFAVMLFVFSLVFSMVTTSASAADTQQDFTYDVELQVPQEQRGLLERHLAVYRWREGERMSEVALQGLVRQVPGQIRELLSTEGFYQPLISTKMERRGSRWLVSLSVDPGEPVRVTGVDIEVIGPFNDGTEENRLRLEGMRSRWSLPVGTIFRHADWEAAKHELLKSLLIFRYPAASIVDSRAEVHPESRAVRLQVRLDSGPDFTFGALVIQGLDRYADTLVRGMNPIVPGSPYSETKLLELQSRLQDSTYFSSTAVHVDTDSEHPEAVPVQVDVIENKSRKLGFGIGLSTDAGVRSLMDYRDLNFLDRTWGLGGSAKLDKKVQSWGGDLQFPLNEQGYRDSVNVLLERKDISGEVVQRMVTGAKRAFLKDRSETAYGVRYFDEKRGVAGATRSRSSTLSPSISWTWRNVDQLLYPTSGYLMSFQLDAAARALLSTRSFLRGDGRLVYFQPLGKRDQLILSGELGIVAANHRSGIPSEFLFRTGGDRTIRGFGFQTLGVQEGSAVVGGRYLALASAEYVHWQTAEWGEAIFLDGGNAADTLGTLKLVYGYGAGARWRSPVGPLNLDLAYSPKMRRGRIHFSVGFNF